jgi:hypothetical protein
MAPIQATDTAENQIFRQIFSFLLHAVLALLAWAALMAAGYALNLPQVPQQMILVLSLFVPLVAGFAINYFRQDQSASIVWLLGLVWFLIIALWVMDMPTGPNECFQCDATDKLSRTFFSTPSPSGLIDNDGPFIATWPAVALLGYAIGARLALKNTEK